MPDHPFPSIQSWSKIKCARTSVQTLSLWISQKVEIHHGIRVLALLNNVSELRPRAIIDAPIAGIVLAVRCEAFLAVAPPSLCTARRRAIIESSQVRLHARFAEAITVCGKIVAPCCCERSAA